MTALATGSLLNAQTLADIAAAINCSKQQLGYLAFQVDQNKRYRKRLVPKRSGGYRLINVPRPDVMHVQRCIAHKLSEIYYPNGRATAYIKKSSILRNALFHEKNRLVLNIDLKDYFEQVTAPRLYGMLMAKPYEMSNVAATVLVRMCCLNGALPQGAPSSPVLANMLTGYLDRLLVDICKRYGCSYSRYSDDITISTNRRKFPAPILVMNEDTSGIVFENLGEELLSAFQRASFTINQAKVRLLRKSDRQEVTGITVNNFVNPRRKLLKYTRTSLAILEKFGEDMARQRYNELHPNRRLLNYSDSVRGRIEYIKQIRGEGDPFVSRFIKRFNSLGYREIKYIHPEDWLSKISKPIVCLENSVDCRQGSAFHIGNGVFITNYHVMFNKGNFDYNMKIVVFGSKQRLAIRMLGYDSVNDLCAFDCSDEERKFLLPSEALEITNDLEVDIGSEIHLAGYPNWAEYDSVHIDKGAVTALTKKGQMDCLRLSTRIVFGNSGGPVVDKKGKVIGVAVAGADLLDDSEHSYLAISPRALKDFVEAGALLKSPIKQID